VFDAPHLSSSKKNRVTPRLSQLAPTTPMASTTPFAAGHESPTSTKARKSFSTMPVFVLDPTATAAAAVPAPEEAAEIEAGSSGIFQLKSALGPVDFEQQETPLVDVSVPAQPQAQVEAEAEPPTPSKRVTFGRQLKPEVFDFTEPPATPVRKGERPSILSSGVTPKPLLKQTPAKVNGWQQDLI